LLLVGIAGGKFFAAQKNPKRSEYSLVKLMKELPVDRKQKVEKQNADMQKQMQAERKKLRQQRDAIDALLARRNIGKEQLETAYAAYRDTADTILRLSQAMMINAFMELSPAARNQMVKENNPAKAEQKHDKQTKKPTEKNNNNNNKQRKKNKPDKEKPPVEDMPLSGNL
jgi:hypothetical protein